MSPFLIFFLHQFIIMSQLLTLFCLEQKLNEHCFERCIPTPGDSLSSKEESCLSTCMEKYISTWNTVSRTYIARVSKESKRLGGQDSAAMASMATGGSGLL